MHLRDDNAAEPYAHLRSLPPAAILLRCTARLRLWALCRAGEAAPHAGQPAGGGRRQACRALVALTRDSSHRMDEGLGKICTDAQVVGQRRLEVGVQVAVRVRGRAGERRQAGGPVLRGGPKPPRACQ